MTALYRTGRQADALAAYQRARDHLVEELGVEPGERLRQLETRILAADEGLTATPAPVADPGGPPPTGTVTFGIVQVTDADRLWVEHRRKMALAVARLDTVVREVTAKHDGTVITSPGETIGTAFHRAHDAVAWAAELQAAADGEPWPGGIDLRLQVGMHTGEAEEHEGGYLGAPVQTAARLAAAANPGQTLATGVTVTVLERDDLRSLGRHRLEGVAAQHEIFQLDSGRHPPLRTASSQQGRLPRQLARLVGRDEDVAALRDAIESGPLVTLVGPGGIGKTSLAVAVARGWHDDVGGRVSFVELDEIQAGGDVVRAVAETLGLAEPGHGDLLASITTAVASSRILVILDNCEHVVGAAADLARALVAGAPQARILATSRESLGVVGEQRYPVEPLDPASAGVELFARRARAVSPDFDLDADRTVVEDICRRLDGLPLAIELAAARTRSLTVEQLRDRLENRLRLLAAQRATTERHHTLHATVQWSHDLLSPDQRRLFERLSVFVGPFDLDAAESVATDADLDAIEVSLLLGDLVERSLVVVETGRLGRRFRLLETLRQFAADQLADDGERQRVEQRHGDWCRVEVARIGALLCGHGELDGVAHLDDLWPNLRAAVERAVGFGDRQRAADLVRPVVTEINLRRRAEVGEWAERVLELTPRDDGSEVVFWLSWALHRHMQSGNRPAFENLVERYGYADHALVRFGHGYLFEDAEELVTVSPEAVTWLRDRDEHPAADLVELSGVGSGLMTTGRFAELVQAATAWADRYRRQGPPTLLYFALGMLGYAAQLQGDRETANLHFLEAAGIDVPAGTYTVSRPVEARAVFEEGDRARALAMLDEHIGEVLDAGTVDVARLVAVEFVNIMARLDRLEDAAPALAYLDTTGDFATLARSVLVADAAHQIDADPALRELGTAPLGATDALHHMRYALRRGEMTQPNASKPV